ncbi:hypothetical protein ES705_24262 [subsurface metagenome]
MKSRNPELMNKLLPFFLFMLVSCSCTKIQKLDHEITGDFNPVTYLWYNEPADMWENTLPVGNGRLGSGFY